MSQAVPSTEGNMCIYLPCASRLFVLIGLYYIVIISTHTEEAMQPFFPRVVVVLVK